MDSQPEINEKMAILIDWLDVHTKFDLSPETLYLTINIVDRFLDVNLVPRRELQLVGISAMLMTSKYEEIWPPEVNDFVTLSDYAYPHEQILIMEKTILGMHTGYLEEQLLASFHSVVGNGKLKVVYRKYSDPHRGAL
ncbi:hypothetical protein TSUD_278260 [Trifolium subterraneum]|uniref:B-like cyclin n=1 Tax=Trifolium subterraneum TaxID=3900 RepID=A0A2Z6MZA7_TRISU|nr:hypothetical protein TSUD_278260 [Trifolium subterraneum]